MNKIIISIDWDTEDNSGVSLTAKELKLPETIEFDVPLPDEMCSAIVDMFIDSGDFADMLSDSYGYCVNSWSISTKKVNTPEHRTSDSQGDLELILRNCFGCKKPFLNEKKLISVENDGTKNYEYLTQSGIKAYDNLIDTVYGLQDIGLINNANNIVEGLDSIVSEEDY